MGVLSRFRDIMASNINALLDKCEDPAKMIDQTLRDLHQDLAEVKKETASVMAEESRCKRVVDEKQAEVTKWQGLVEKAVLAGNDADAAKFLTQKNQAQSVLTSATEAYNVASANSQKMRQMHDKLVNDINELESIKDAIKAKISVAKAQQKINDMTSSVNSEASMSAFARMEAKADRMLDSANAEAELNASSANPIDDLASKYDNTSDAAVQDELAALKAKMGLTATE